MSYIRITNLNSGGGVVNYIWIFLQFSHFCVNFAPNVKNKHPVAGCFRQISAGIIQTVIA